MAFIKTINLLSTAIMNRSAYSNYTYFKHRRKTKPCLITVFKLHKLQKKKEEKYTTETY